MTPSSSSSAGSASGGGAGGAEASGSGGGSPGAKVGCSCREASASASGGWGVGLVAMVGLVAATRRVRQALEARSRGAAGAPQAGGRGPSERSATALKAPEVMAPSATVRCEASTTGGHPHDRRRHQPHPPRPGTSRLRGPVPSSTSSTTRGRRASTRGPAFAQAHADRAPKELFASPGKLEVHEVLLSTDDGDRAADQ